MYDLLDFDDFTAAEKYILENIHDRSHIYLLTYSPNKFFVFYDENDVAVFLVGEFELADFVVSEIKESGKESFDTYQSKFDIYSYITGDQRVLYSSLYANAESLGNDIFKQKMRAVPEYTLSASLTACQEKEK